MPKAIVLLSGGLDSAVTLYHAKAAGYQVEALAFHYGQRHAREVRSARAVARAAGVSLKVVRIALPWKGSALLDRALAVPSRGAAIAADAAHIPSTYVPGRNIIFVSFAASFAEAAGAEAIFIGANAVDYSGYPDCRPGFFKAFQKALDAGLKVGVEAGGIRIMTPLIDMGKADIIRLGLRLGVPFGHTWSCYNGAAVPCGTCDSCRLRSRGFADAGAPDPAIGPKKGRRA